jgi:hypothetical protein
MIKIKAVVGREVLLQPGNVVETDYAVEKTAVPGLVESGAICRGGRSLQILEYIPRGRGKRRIAWSRNV